MKAILLGAACFGVWVFCFDWAIRRELKRCTADRHAISRLYITDLWAVIIALLPAVWLLSIAIKNTSGDWTRYATVAAVFFSELLGMFGAMIRLASQNARRAPTRFGRALWLSSGAFIGLCVLIGSMFIAMLLLMLVAFIVSFIFSR